MTSLLRHVTAAAPPRKPQNPAAAHAFAAATPGRLSHAAPGGGPHALHPASSPSLEPHAAPPAMLHSPWRPLATLSASQLTRVIQLAGHATGTAGPCTYAPQPHGPSPTWLALVSQLSLDSMRLLRPPQLAAIITAFVQLGHYPGEHWLDAFDAACFSHPGPFDPQSTADVLVAMAIMAAAGFPGACSTSGGSGGHGSCAFSFPTACYLKVLRQPDVFEYRQLSVLLVALDRLGMRLDEGFLEHVGGRLGALLAGMRREDARRLAMQPVTLLGWVAAPATAA